MPLPPSPVLDADAIETPALLVDLDILESNIAVIAEGCRRRGVGWRPHGKGLKSPDIARLQMAAGAIGITCATLGEAEAMAAAGIPSILIANQVVGPGKITRLVALLRGTEVIVAVDDAGQAATLAAAAAAAAGTTLAVVMEVDLGLGRAGVAPGAPVLELASAIVRHPSLRLAGVMGWESRALTIPDPAEKARVVAETIGQLTWSADLCRAEGFSMDIVSCGGTGTFPICAEQPGVTEVQVGGGVVSDMHYRSHYCFDGPQALTLLATVSSRPTPTRVILDAGRKAMSADAAVPHPLGLGRVASLRLSAEHATIELEEPSVRPRIGDRVSLIVGYTDSTVHLHDRLHAMRGARLEAVWPVVARSSMS